MKITPYYITFLLLLLWQNSIGQYSIEEIPNPKTSGDYFVSNPDAIIDASTEDAIESLCKQIEAETTAEIAVVAVNDIDGSSEANFATALLNEWGVGKAGVNNGVVVLLVKDRRKVEFRIGDGIENILTTSVCQAIQQTHMIPSFKSGDYSTGLLKGVEQIGNKLGYNNKAEIDQGNTLSSFEEIGTWVTDKIEAPKRGKKIWLSDPDDIIKSEDEKLLIDSLEQWAEKNKFSVHYAVYEDTRLRYNDVDSAMRAIRETWNLEDEAVLLFYDSKKQNIRFNEQLPRRLQLVDQLLAHNIQHFVNNDLRRYRVEDDYALVVQKLEISASTIFRLWSDPDYRNRVSGHRKEMQEAEEQARLEQAEREKEYKEVYKDPYYEPNYWMQGPLGIYAILAGIFTIINLILITLSLFFIPSPYTKHNMFTFSVLKVWMVLFPIPHIPMWFWMMHLRKKFRAMPRNSETGNPMHLMSEQEEDQYLTSGQAKEEAIKSIDYDVWVTGDKKEVMILSYPIWFSGYGRCPKCNYKTWYKVYNKTIRAATYSSSGTGERKHACKHCHHSRVQRYTIPKKQRSNTSSSSSSSWSSSSSGGSSWGGGSSSGGGGGSSW